MAGKMLPKKLINKSTIRGFTLLEVVLALALAGAGVAILAVSYMQAVYAQQNVANRMSAMILGSGKLAELEQGAEPALAGGFDEPFSKYKWSANVDTAKDGTSAILLTVEWKEGESYATVYRQIKLKGYKITQ